jgi:hypothetical protein
MSRVAAARVQVRTHRPDADVFGAPIDSQFRAQLRPSGERRAAARR